jgi:hypothetical protein
MFPRSRSNPSLARTLTLAIPMALTAPLAAGLLGCSGATVANDGMTTEPQPSAPPAATAPVITPAVPPGEKVPSARVAAVEPARDGGLYLRAKILFKNPTDRKCRFLGYRLTWGTSSKEIKLDAGFIIPAGENRERWLKVHPEDGDLSDLTEMKSLVQVKTECSDP